MNYKPDNKGVSLPLTIGLLLLIAALTTTVNLLVVRALRASHEIEAADKAYLAAEAGIEDALYELSLHSAGYQTPDFDDPSVRQNELETNIKWNNEWQIASDNTNANDCDNLQGWASSITPSFCGKIYEGEKLTINLFRDNSDATSVDVNEVSVNEPESSDISKLDLSGGFFIRFRIPPEVVEEFPTAFPAGLNPLPIDNDSDYSPADPLGTLNEDGSDPTDYPPAPCPYSGSVPVADNDCDGREDEDSPQDVLFLWKIIDDAGHTFTPIRGCKANWGAAALNYTYNISPFADSSICEESFYRLNFEVFVDIDQNFDYGIDETGNPIRLREFLGNVGSNDNPRLEILPVAPFEVINSSAGIGEAERVPFPYIEYGIQYTSADILPGTSFELRSDGYFQDYKQSISTNVLPESSTKLLDLTIIQQ